MFSNRKIVLITLLIVVGTLAVYFLLVFIPRKLAEQTYEGARVLGKDLQEALHFTPEIRVNNVVILQQQSDILELATVSQRISHTYQWTHTRLGSTKKIDIQGSFIVKAGFDMNEAFAITLKDGKATVTMPAPRILSLELQPDVIFKDENGFWNWIDEADRSSAINAFTKDANRIASDTRIQDDATQSLRESLSRILQGHVDAYEMQIGNQQFNWSKGSE